MNLIEKVSKYRKSMNKACNITTKNNYVRMYTDSRKNGVRSKYWNCNAMPLQDMQKFVQTHPIVQVGLKRYSVTLDHSKYTPPTSHWASVSLKFKQIN